MTDHTHVQAWADRAAALRKHERAAVAGLAPPILAADSETVTFRRVRMTLREWCASDIDPSARDAMKLQLRSRIHELHEAGICHRDLHSENVMIDDNDSILFIDFALAEWVDPSWPCYDLTGPSDQVVVPYAHRSQGGHENGVWWGPVLSQRCLTNVLGAQPT